MTLSRTPSKIVGAAAALGEHTDEVLKEFGFSAEGNRGAAQGQGDLSRRALARGGRHAETAARAGCAPDDQQTDKMLSRKEGRVGYVIFNNPERHNAVSLEMWAATGRDPRRLRAATTRCAWSCVTGAGGKAFVSGADISKFENERSLEDGSRSATTRPSSRPMPASTSSPSRPSP